MDEAGDYLDTEPDVVFPTDCSQSNETFSRLQLLYSQRIIAWPNFSECLPHCEMCQIFASDSTYILYNLVLIGFILPIIGFCGLLGNGISAFIYCRPEMRSSTNLYLCALGCSDCAVICTAIFLFCFDIIRRYSLHISLMFGAFSPIVYPAGMTAQTCSVYFTLMAAADCFVQVCLTDSCRKVVSREFFVKCMVLFIVVFSVLYNVPHCLETVVLECWHTRFESRSLEVCPDPFRFLPSYKLIYYKYMYSIFLAIGPVVVLVILTLCIIGVSVILKKGGGDSGDTIALILVVLLFIACNVAALLLNVFEVRLGEILGPYINYVVDASNVLVVFNSSCNFVIYVTFSLAFRRTLRRYIFKTNAKSTVQTNTKPSKTTGQTLATTATKTTLATIGNINLCTSKYSSSSKDNNDSSSSNSNSSSSRRRSSSSSSSSSGSGGAGNKSNSTAIVMADENSTNYNQHYHRHHQHLSYNGRRHQRLEHVEQLSRKETANHVPKAAQLEILI
uniref:G_PROTEIN_RECEP_F1_2 domain-containing protein n=1 Tax=Elaeophora elaphi TaxID=1147741 RepID=A0A0R3RYY7_9BILA